MHIILPNHGGNGIDLPYNILTAVLVSIFIYSTYKITITKAHINQSSCILFFLAAIILTINIFSSKNALISNLGIAILFCTSFLIILTTSYKNELGLFLYLISAAGCIQALIGLLQSFGINPSIGGASLDTLSRPLGTFQQPNVLASFIATGLACASYLFYAGVYKNKIEKILLSIAVILPIVCLIITASRTGWIALGFTLLVFTILNAKNKQLKTWLPIITLGAIAGTSLIIFDTGNADLADDKFRTSDIRSTLYPQTIELIKQNPIWGVGEGNFETTYVHEIAAMYHQGLIEQPPESSYGHPHNEVLHIWVEFGILPVILILLLVAITLRQISAITGDKKFVALALIFPITLHAILEYPFRHSFPHILVFLIILHVINVWSGAQTYTFSFKKYRSVVSTLNLLVFLVANIYLINALIMNHALWKVEIDPENNAHYLNWPFYPGENNTRYEFVVHGAMYSLGMKNNDRQALTIFTEWAENQKEKTPRVNLYHAMVNAYMKLDKPEMAIKALDEVRYLFPQKEHPTIAISSSKP